MSDIIYTPPASGGGGTTINPTDNFIPVRSNATTFVDSFLENGSDYLKSTYSTNDIGLFLNFANKIFEFGDFNFINSGASFFIDDGNSTIYTQHSSHQWGLYFDFVNNYFQIGDFTVSNNGTYLTIDDANIFIQTYYNGNGMGLRLDFNNIAYFLGDFNVVNNGTYFLIDDSTQKMTFNTQYLNFLGGSLTNGATVIPVGKNLLVTINGLQYHIPLYN